MSAVPVRDDPGATEAWQAGDELPPHLLAQARTLAAREATTVMAALTRVIDWPRGQWMAALGASFGYPVCDAAQLDTLQPDFTRITYTDCSRLGVLVARLGSGQHCLVLSDPFDATVEAWGLRCCEGAQVMLAHPADLSEYLSRQEANLRAMDDIGGGDGHDVGEAVAAVITLGSIRDDASAVVRLVNSTLYDALKLRASDIHLECDAHSLHVMYRVDGVLMPIATLPGAEVAQQVVSRIKVMADLDIAESRVPQDGRFKVRINARDIDLRVSIMPSLFGEDAVLRLLDRQALTAATTLRLDHLGLQPAAIAAIQAMALKPHGMLLVTGPTGSGKTTTLYAAISEIHTGRDKIVTIEDPVEYRLPRILQIPVNEKKGLTFARGLRSILRHDPDKIMVGEIRDGETAQIAVQAALTGHLVLTTVHANSVFDVLGRFVNMGVEPYSLASALNGVVAQRLVRMICTHCVQDCDPAPRMLALAGLREDQVATWHFRHGAGCAHCRGSGYHGRRSAAEVLTLDDELREAIVSMAPVSRLKQLAHAAGMVALKEALWQWVAQGETTLEEVVRVAG
jgi:general secretion pathway protein E